MKHAAMLWIPCMVCTLCLCSSPDPVKDSPGGATIHELNPTPSTVAWGHYWSETPPVLRIRSGDIVNVRAVHVGSPEVLESAGLPPGDVEQDLRDIHREVTDRGPGGHVLTGPVYVEDAEPGDVLEVRIRSIECVIPYAYNSLSPDRGFLTGEFQERRTRIIPFDLERNVALFAEGIEIPLRPFFGSMGVAPPPGAGRIDSAPPWIHGGNMDNKELVAGTVLFLPVHVEGALFQVGDGHGAQGDGEVCITALETSLKGELQFVLHEDRSLEWPRAETPTHYISMGTNENLDEAAKIAVRGMITFLVSEKGMTREDAYMLCSVAADFRITQLVDGRLGVHGMLPKTVFTTK